MKLVLGLAAIVVVTAIVWMVISLRPAGNLTGGGSTDSATKKVNPKDGLTYVRIPPGTFTMGCSPGDDTHCNAKPAHQVTITKGFWMGQTEVTQAAYERVIGSNPSNFKGASLPVERINWEKARAYCVAAGMRLPTEAEWEYAARGGNASARYGDLDAVAWYSDNSGRKTHEVGQKLANDYGLHDMLGNVSEWVADWYGPYGVGSVNDPQGPSSGSERVLRGGSWDYPPIYASASYRTSSGYVGVRCAGDSL